MIAVIQKHDTDDFSTWFAEIDDADPLWLALLEKYGNAGSSLRGSLKDNMAEIEQNLR